MHTSMQGCQTSWEINIIILCEPYHREISYASNRLARPISITKTVFYWPRLSPATPCAFRNAHAHNLLLYSNASLIIMVINKHTIHLAAVSLSFTLAIHSWIKHGYQPFSMHYFLYDNLIKITSAGSSVFSTRLSLLLYASGIPELIKLKIMGDSLPTYGNFPQ